MQDIIKKYTQDLNEVSAMQSVKECRKVPNSEVVERYIKEGLEREKQNYYENSPGLNESQKEGVILLTDMLEGLFNQNTSANGVVTIDKEHSKALKDLFRKINKSLRK